MPSIGRYIHPSLGLKSIGREPRGTVTPTFTSGSKVVGPGSPLPPGYPLLVPEIKSSLF